MSNAKEAGLHVIRTLEAAGFETYFAGGCVRDEVLGLDPSDYDVASAATPDEVVGLFPDAKLVGEHFGVVLVAEGGHAIEVATFRGEGAYSDGRHPDAVQFVKTPQEDVERRDFTINGLLMDARGNVFDFTGGQADLRDGLIRAIGDPNDRFNEDHLRMLRAIRFAARFSFTIEEATFSAIRENASKITKISKERINKELSKMLTEGHAGKAIRELKATGLLHFILPEIDILDTIMQSPDHHPEGDVFVHTTMMLDLLKPGCSLTLALATLFHDIGKAPTQVIHEDGKIKFKGHEDVGADMTHRILTDLKFPNAVIDEVVTLVEEHMKPHVFTEMRKSKKMRLIRQPYFPELLKLNLFDIKCSNKNLTTYNAICDFRDTVPEAKLRAPRLLTGDDLIEMGFRPGPFFKDVLTFVEDLQLEGRIRNREQAGRAARMLRDSTFADAEILDSLVWSAEWKTRRASEETLAEVTRYFTEEEPMAGNTFMNDKHERVATTLSMILERQRAEKDTAVPVVTVMAKHREAADAAYPGHVTMHGGKTAKVYAELLATREALAKAEALNLRWNRASSSAAPGSEFVNEPELIFERVRTSRHTLMNQLVKAKRGEV